MAAYNKSTPILTPIQGKFNDLQSTVIVVPTSLKSGKHENNWKIIDCLFKHFKTMGWVPPPPGGFNHGELCPQVCN